MTIDEAIALACSALNFAEDRFRSYRGYPSEDYRRARIQEAQDAKRLLRSLSSRPARPAPVHDGT